MREVLVAEIAGSFAENKDAAQDIRVQSIFPALRAGDDVVLDFSGVDLATQSFIHALVADVIRKMGPSVLDRVTFKGCNDGIKSLVSIVVEYSQDVVEEPKVVRRN